MSEVPRVKIYTTSTCPFCRMAKEFLRSKGVEFQEIDVGKDTKGAMEMLEKSGQMGVPVLEIEGQIIVGFDRDAISRALGLTG